MVKIQITKEQDNCVIVYWAELTGTKGKTL